MLILGPSEYSRTSQVINPMIWQDMQNSECGITVLEPNGNLAKKTYAMAKMCNRKVTYFNPVSPLCPYFNPLYGIESDVIENIVTAFLMFSPDSAQFFKDMNEQLLRNALRVLKRLLGNDATFIDLDTLIQNIDGQGEKMVVCFSKLNAETPQSEIENNDTTLWFLNDYFPKKSKTYEHCSDVRSKV